MKKFITIILSLLLCLALCVGLTGCTEVDHVSYNLGQQADNFNLTRQITVFNTRTDTVLFQMTGLMSLQNNDTDELEIIVQTGANEFKKHFIYLGNDVTYTVEDVSGAHVDKYFYEFNINPMLYLPFVDPTYID